MNVPPHNLEAEESVLGAMLLSPRAIEECSEILHDDDFYRDSHRVIFRAAVELHSRGDLVDGITIADALTRTKQLDKVGGAARIAELIALTPATSNVGHYARIVSNEASRRALIRAGQLITQTAQEGGSADDLVAKAEEHLSGATTLRVPSNALPLTAELPEYLEELREAYTSGKGMFGYKTGFDGLDNMLLGLWPGQLVLIAARPAQGKSALALNIAENFADRGDAVQFNALEMSRRELLIRSVARAARVDGKRLQTGLIEPEQAEKVGDGVKVVQARTNLFVDDDGTMTVSRLRAEAARRQRQDDIKLLIVDYLQLMQGEGDNRNEQVGYISRGLKQLARQLNIPVIALSQMSRAIERNGTPRRPVLADLRDSGSLEQDADVVIFLHDDANYDSSKEADGSVEAIVAKNRKGETGSVRLLFLRRFSEFRTPTLAPAGADEEAA